MARLLLIDHPETSILDCLRQNPEWKLFGVPDHAAYRAALQEDKFDLVIINQSSVGQDVSLYCETGEKLAPSLPILLITCPEDDNSTIQTLKLGALNFVPATATSHELYQAANRILALSQFSRVQQKMLGRCETCDLQFLLSNDPAEVPGLVAYLRDVLAAITGIGHREQMRVAVSIEEALQNAIVHGNLEISSRLREANDDQFNQLLEIRQEQSPYQERQVRLEASITRNSVMLVIADEGPGFDLNKLPDPTSQEHLLLPHGRGLLLMRAFMDEVHYTPPGNVLTLRKQFPESAVQGK